ncbi:MAG: CvpA family protein [Bacteroidales bacterium]|nr:CvpA family protein [Bacteroidales bacterium]MBD5282365.1 CvpA family protein [Bacteroides sp.]MDE6032328.1 CvpA family protein [Muribaculaceae bacterium]MBD5343112.1 CvpA family protein [Bacteroides sp.]MBD5352554.1 CvpA family protein [Bacteroides sp.]
MNLTAIITVILIAGTIAMAIYGAYRGAIRQIGSVAAFLLGFLAAKLFSGRITQLFEWPQMLSYVMVFVAVYITVVFLARIMRLTVKMLLLGPLDRLFGCLIGAAKWMLFASLLINLIWACGFSPECLQTSTAHWIGRFAPKIFGFAQGYLN